MQESSLEGSDGQVGLIYSKAAREICLSSHITATALLQTETQGIKENWNRCLSNLIHWVPGCSSADSAWWIVELSLQEGERWEATTSGRRNHNSWLQGTSSACVNQTTRSGLLHLCKTIKRNKRIKLWGIHLSSRACLSWELWATHKKVLI